MDKAGVLKPVPVFGHVTVATYFRVVLGDVLPGECGKVIYLDADTVVLRDLSELWQMDMKGKSMLAAQEGQCTVSSHAGIPEYGALGIPPDAPLFNAGVFVADLDKWRRSDISRKVLNYLKRNFDHVTYWDQDGLNAILWQDVIIIPKLWNYRVDCHEVPALPDASSVDVIRASAGIVHYASATKPWHYYAEHPGKIIFYDYVKQTAWAGWRPRMPLKALRNRHIWGRFIGQLPWVGPVWQRWHPPDKGGV
jgi:lipopolysaccharide biosynthesis glycosyltransferase